MRVAVMVLPREPLERFALQTQACAERLTRAARALRGVLDAADESGATMCGLSVEVAALLAGAVDGLADTVGVAVVEFGRLVVEGVEEERDCVGQ